MLLGHTGPTRGPVVTLCKSWTWKPWGNRGLLTTVRGTPVIPLHLGLARAQPGPPGHAGGSLGHSRTWILNLELLWEGSDRRTDGACSRAPLSTIGPQGGQQAVRPFVGDATLQCKCTGDVTHWSQAPPGLQPRLLPWSPIGCRPASSGGKIKVKIGTNPARDEEGIVRLFCICHESK